MKEKEVTNLELIMQTQLVQHSSDFFKWLLSNLEPSQATTKELVHELLMIFVHLSADDDPAVNWELLQPHYEVLQILNSCFQAYLATDDGLLYNVLWILGNLLGENNP